MELSKLKIYFIILFLLVNETISAQYHLPLSNLREKRIPVTSVSLIVDSLSIIPQSFSITNIPSSYYSIDVVNSIFKWVNIPKVDSVIINYRVFPIKLNASVKHLDYEIIRNNFIADNPIKLNSAGDNHAFPLFDFKGMETEGSFGRSISFGNSQDAVLNSSMNLQISGYIGDSLELVAAISDNSIPIQPDGNTKDLRDFDRIFLQIKKKSWQTSFGDIDLKEHNNYFLNFYKRLQGASFSSENKLNSKTTNSFLASGAIAKGKFTKNNIIALEGNQGPYRLQGSNNELYFVVLAGTERVFIDGELLQRGENEDYVINYNAAEITFTPKRFISKESRIQVEFEYADRNYLNTQWYGSNELKYSNKLTFNIAAYSNSDSKYSTIDQELDDTKKNFLSNIGDSIQNAFVTNAVSDTFNPGKILYKIIDTLYNGSIHDSVFVQSSDNNYQLYNVVFTYVGPGKGNYHQLFNGSNGKVFQWIQPGINDAKNGDYEPISYLVTPKKHQLFTMGLKYFINPNFNMATDLAMSNYDVNLLSNRDKENNKGFAGKFIMNKNFKKIRILYANYKLESTAGYEFTQQQFKPLERIRNIEFLRDWSLYQNVKPADESLSSFSMKFIGQNGGLVKYDFTNYNRKDNYNGNRQSINQYSVYKQWVLFSDLNRMTFNSQNQKGDFFRPSIDIKKGFKKIKNIQVSFRFSAEYNRIKDKLTDTLNVGSFAFNKYEWSLRSDTNKFNKWQLNYYKRVDLLPAINKFLKSDQSDNYSLSTSLMNNPKSQLNANITYRALHVINNGLSNLKDDKTILGRAEYNFSFIKDFFNGSLFYEIGSGQEQKREFSYVPVAIGQGEYAWNDYNGNGIEELNEFELAIFQDQKKYIRIYTPTNQYVKANSIQLNYNIELTPKNIIKYENNNLTKLIARSSTSSTLQINKKNISNNNFLFNPFDKEITDTSLIFNNSYFSNTFYFNRTNYKWGLDLTQSQSNMRALLTYGYENKNIQMFIGRLRLNLNKSLFSNLVYRNAKNILITSGYKFDNKNYEIHQNTYEPSLTYVYKSIFRATLSYSYIEKNNKIDSLEKSINNSVSAEIKYNVFSNSSLSFKGSYNKIAFYAYPGAVNSAVGYLLLDGLSVGNNMLWNIDFTKRFAGNIEINIQYEGRKPDNSRTINLGKASIRAIF